MADAVTSQVILDGERLFIGKYTNLSDGTGENAVPKVRPSQLAPNAAGQPCTGLKINRLWSSATTIEVRILWDAATDLIAWVVPQNSNFLTDFSSFGGIPNNAGAGKTGDILFTTNAATNGKSYVVILECIKTYG